MEHQQERHEKHEKDRKEHQAEERQSEERFSKPGPTIHPIWFLAIGIAVTLTALVVWMAI